MRNKNLKILIKYFLFAKAKSQSIAVAEVYPDRSGLTTSEGKRRRRKLGFFLAGVYLGTGIERIGESQKY